MNNPNPNEPGLDDDLELYSDDEIHPEPDLNTVTGEDAYKNISGEPDIEFFDSEGGLTAEALAFLADEDSNGRFI